MKYAFPLFNHVLDISAKRFFSLLQLYFCYCSIFSSHDAVITLWFGWGTELPGYGEEDIIQMSVLVTANMAENVLTSWFTLKSYDPGCHLQYNLQ